MTSSSPSPPGALHQYTNTDGDQDDGPEPSEPFHMEPAKLLQQEDHAQTDEHEGPDRNARTSGVVFFDRHRLSFHRSSSGNSRGWSRPVGASKPVEVVQAEGIGSLYAHQFRLGRLVSLDRHIQHEGCDADA